MEANRSRKDDRNVNKEGVGNKGDLITATKWRTKQVVVRMTSVTTVANEATMLEIVDIGEHKEILQRPLIPKLKVKMNGIFKFHVPL